MDDGEKPIVMVVEDELSVLEMMRDILKAEGIDSIGISRTEMALSTARRFKPALFLIDIMLLGESGIEVAQKLRSHEFVETPMIAMSASGGMLRYANQSHLFNASISKPFDIDALMELVHQMLDEKPPSA